MAVLLPTPGFVRTIGTGETVQLGGITVTHHTELTYVRLLLLINNLSVSTQRLRIKVYSSSDYTGLVGTGDWAELADIDGLGFWYWGWLRFSFARLNLSSNITYYLALETENYTGSDSSYLALSLDWPEKYYAGVYLKYAMQVYGYRELQT
jgi:hypothetical protein